MASLTSIKERKREAMMISIHPDYLKSKTSSQGLVKRIEDFWHKKGHHYVKAWVETVAQMNGEKYFVVRSNMTFKVPERE